MTAEIIATLVTAVLLAVGCLGIVVPVLPGSILVVVGLVVWALTVQAAEGWVVLVLGLSGGRSPTGPCSTRPWARWWGCS